MSEDDSDGSVVSSSNTNQFTASQTESVLHLQEIVGSIDQDTAADILRECDWNLESAVNKVFGLSDPVRDHSNVRHRSTTSPSDAAFPTVNLVPPNQRVLRIADSQPRGWWWWSLWILFEPFRLTYNLITGIMQFFTSFLWPDPRHHVIDPVGDVRSFIEFFKSTYVDIPSESNGGRQSSLSLLPPFYEGSYAHALQEAKESLRFLVVYLHGDSHEDTRDFCINTLQNENVLQFLSNSQQIIFWGCNINSPEGYRVSRTLREHTYPFIGVIGLSNLTVSEFGQYATSTVGMALLGRIEGAVKPSDLVVQLRSILDDHQGATVTARLDRREREARARIREEQDLAYQQSLAQDRAKLAAKEEELRHAQLEAVKRSNLARQQEALRRAREARRVYWETHLPVPPLPSDPSTVQLSVKMPSGRRISRVFSITDSVKILYYFVLTHEDAPNNFEIQSNFPKRLLPCQPAEESDLEDYLATNDDQQGLTKHQSSSVPSDYHFHSDTTLRGSKRSSDALDWSPNCPNDPPSFQQLGLCKPEVLFIIDRDA